MIPGYVLISEKDLVFRKVLNDNQMHLQYIGTADNVIVPNEYMGKPITDASYMFLNNTTVRRVIFQSSVVAAISACSGCHNLEYIDFGDSILDLREVCWECTNLKNIGSIPQCCVDMSGAFAYCNHLTTIPTLSKSLVQADRIFLMCTRLRDIPKELPFNVEDISYGFYGCTDLQKAPILQENIVRMDSVFENCFNLYGDILFFCNPTQFHQALLNTGLKSKKTITLTGNSVCLEQIKDTSATPNHINVVYTKRQSKILQNLKFIKFGQCYN